MIGPILALGVVSFAIAWLLTYVMIRIAPRIGFVDKPGHRKIHSNPKPLGGGVAMFWAVAFPILVGIAMLGLGGDGLVLERFKYVDGAALVDGARQQMPLAFTLLATLGILHVLGLIDDRKPLGPLIKLLVQFGAAAAITIPFKEVRVLTNLAAPTSILITVLWITAITNAFNFLDNMDGLSAGVAAVCTTAFLITTILIQQWFVAATLALLLGSLLGFLCWNFPPARIFMGDSGSLVIGFILGVLTVRTTYIPLDRQATFATNWYGVLAPLLVLALPLYDLIVVSIIRLSRDKSPFVGDTNHFSHRLVARGMSRRTAVLCLYLVTAATSIGAILLPYVQSGFAAGLILSQTMLVLGLVALLEQHPLSPGSDETA